MRASGRRRHERRPAGSAQSWRAGRSTGETINRVCGSGLQAVVHAVEAVQAGFVDAVLAGGTESMSNAPFLLKGARWGYRMGNAEVIDSMLSKASPAP